MPNILFLFCFYIFSLFLSASFEQECLERYQKQIEYLNNEELNEIFSNKNNSLLFIASKYQEVIEDLSQLRMQHLLNQPFEDLKLFTQDKSKLLSSAFHKKINNLNLSNLSVNNEIADDYNKILLHVLGDDFGLNSGLEGANANLTLAYRIRQLELIRSSMNNRSFIKDKAQAMPCYDLANITDDIKSIYDKSPLPDLSQDFLTKAIEQSKLALELYNLSKNSQSEFRQKLVIELNKLKKGKSLYFPSSWSGHAIVFELEKENDENINFKMYNSGDGIGEYHASLVVGFEKKVFPYIELTGVKIKDFSSVLVIQALTDLHSSPKDKPSKPSSFYKSFLSMLKGKKVEPNISKDEFKDPQNSGTCSYASLPWVMSSCLINSDNKNTRQEINQKSAYLEYLIKLLTLREYSTVFNAYKNLQTSDESINLFKKSINYFSSKTIDAFSDNVLNNKELTPIVINLQSIKSKLEQVDKAVAGVKNYSKLTGNTQAKAVKFPQIADLPAAQELVNAKASEKLEFKKPITRYILRLKELSEISRNLSLNIDTFKDQNKIEKLLEISEYAEEYLYNFLQAINNKELPKKALSMEQLLVSIKFLAVADMLSEGIIPSTYSKTWGKILYNDLSTVTIKDPFWQEQYSLLKKYYENKKESNDIDFFGFDLIPTGAMYQRRIFHDKNAIKNISLNKDYEKKFEDDKIFKDYQWAKNLTKNIEVITNKKIEDENLKLKQTVFNNVKKIALVPDYLLTGDLTDNKYINNNKIKFKCFELDISNFIYSRCYLSLFKDNNSRSGYKYEKNELKKQLLLGKEVFSSTKPNFHLSTYDTDFNKNNEIVRLLTKNKLEKTTYNRKRLTTSEVFQRSAIEEKTPVLGQELMRAILNLSSKKDLQIERVLGFFSKRPYLLGFNNDIYRKIFEKLIFEEDLLNKELSINPKLAKELSHFCDNIYKNFQKNNDIKGMVFILKINNLFEFFAQKNDISNTRFMSSIDEYMNMIKLNNNSIDEKLFIYGNLLLSYKDHKSFTEKEAEYLLLASFYYANYKINKKELVFNNNDDLNIRNMFFEKNIDINNKIINNFIKNIFGENNYDFKKYLSNDNIHEDKNNKIIVDINNLAVYKDNKKLSSFPISLADFKKVFGDDAVLPDNALAVSQDIYEWRNGDETFRVKIGDWGDNEYLRNFGERYSKYYLLKDKQVADLVDSTFMLDLLKNNWLKVSHSNLFTKIITTDKDTDKQITAGYLANDNNPYINRISDNARLFSVTSTDEHFKTIEDERHIYVWDKFSDGNNYEEVNMPRLGLTFRSKNYVRHDCADFKDYILAPKQFVEALGKPINYLVCEPKDFKSKETKIVIMVAQKLEIKDSNKSLSRTNFSPQREPEMFAQDFSKKIVFYNIKEDSTLEPKDRLAHFYLVLRYLWQQKYDEAKELLDINASYLSKFTKQEENILDQIIAGNSIDHDVRALTLRLLAVYVKNQNYLYTNGYDNNFDYFTEERSIFTEYVNKLNTLTNLLDKDIEFKIAQILRFYDEKYYDKNGVYANKILSKNIINRLNYLADKKVLADNIYANKFLPKEVKKDFYEQEYLLKNIKNSKITIGIFKDKIEEKKDSNSFLNVPAKQIITNDNISVFLQILLLDKDAKIDTDLRAKALEAVNEFITEKNDNLSDEEIINNIYLLIDKAFLDMNKVYKKEEDRINSLSIARIKMLYYLTELENKQEFKSLLNDKLLDNYISLPQSGTILFNIKEAVESGNVEKYYNDKKLEGWLEWNDKNKEKWPLEKFKKFAKIHELMNKLFDDANKFYENYDFQKPHKQEFIQQSIELEIQAKTRAPKYKRRLVTPLFYNIINRITIKDPLDGKNIGNIEEEILKIKNSIKNDEENILKLARKYEPKQIDANYYELLKLADIEKQIEIKDIIYLLLTNKLEDFYNINGSINSDEAILLKHYVISYLLNATYLSYLQKVKLGSIVPNMKRSYDYVNNIAYLVFEYFMDILIRPNQKQALDDLGIKDGKIAHPENLGALIELIMGAGKTSVIVPLIAAITSDTNWLNIIVLPESLISSMSYELSQTLAKSFKKHLDIIDFNIYDINKLSYEDAKEKRLNNLKEALVNAKKQGRSLVTTNSSIQGLFLSIINAFENKSINENIYQKFIEIIKLFKEQTRVTIDEIDLALDVMKSKQIAAGKKVHLPKIVQETVSNFYKMLASQKDIYKTYSLSFIPYSKGKPLTKDSFAEFKKLVVDKIFSSSLFEKYIENNNQKQDLKDYLLNPNINNYKSMIANTKNDDAKNVFAVLAEELNSVFELTAIKKINIHYGSLPKPQANEQEKYIGEYEQSKFIAIPYNNGNPMITSRFANPIEALNYTIQKELFGDNFVNYIAIEIEKLKKNIDNFDYLYKNLVGELLAKKSIFEINYEDIMNIANSLNLNKKIDLINDHALSQIRLYEMQIQTNAQIYEFLFHTVQGFSGTLWNYQTFPDKFLPPVLSETSKITKEAIIKSTPKIKILEENDLPGLIDQIYGNWQNPGSFIDEAGMLRSFSNQDVAKAIIQKLKDYSNISGIIFYDDTNNLLIMDKEYKVESLSQTKIPIDNRIAFWDKLHTTGSDLKLNSYMSAKMSFDRHLKLRDLEQSVWRLRGLDKNQKIIELVSFKKDIKIIENKLNKNNLTFEDILDYSYINQKEQLDFINWRSFTQGLKNKLIKASFSDLFSSSKLDMDKYVNKLRELVVMQNEQQPYEIYGLPVNILEKDTAIKIDLDNIKNKKAYSNVLDDEINKFIEHKKPNLAQEVMLSNIEQGQEVEVELNTQTQAQAQVQTQVQAEQFDPNKPAPKDIVYDWNLDNNIFNVDFYTKFKNIVYTTKQALEKDPSLSALFEFMNDNIYLSKNFAPIQDKNFEFFDQYAKALNNVLLVFDSNKNKYSLVLLDLSDVKEWKNFLLNHKYSEQDRLKIAIFDLELNTITAGYELEINDFLTLIVQAKFFAGILEYSSEEKVALREWIINSNKIKEFKIIFDKILMYKNETLKYYKNSFLYELFL